MRKKLQILLGALVFLGLGVAVWLLPELAKEAEARENLRALAIAAERYGIDHFELIEWPLDVNQLVKEGYLDRLPTNPYTRQPVKLIAPDGKGRPGDISHYRETEEILPGYVIATNYVFLTYSRRRLADERRTHYHTPALDERFPKLAALDWRYVLKAVESSDGKPTDHYIRHKNAQKILHDKD